MTTAGMVSRNLELGSPNRSGSKVFRRGELLHPPPQSQTLIVPPHDHRSLSFPCTHPISDLSLSRICRMLHFWYWDTSAEIMNIHLLFQCICTVFMHTFQSENWLTFPPPHVIWEVSRPRVGLLQMKRPRLERANDLPRSAAGKWWSWLQRP